MHNTTRQLSWDLNRLPDLVAKHNNWKSVLKELGLSHTAAGNYRTMLKYSRMLELDTSHFLGKNGGHRNGNVKYTVEEMFVENGVAAGYNVRKRLLKEGLKDYVCEICGITEWNNQPISLHMDHINGINNDHRIENLRLLCPNCHSQTETFGSRNVRRKNS